MGWTLMLPFLFDAYKYEYDNGNNIGQHLNKLFGAARKAGNVNAYNIEAAEKEGTQNGRFGSPDCENNYCNGKPSTVAEAVVGPCSGRIVHNKIETSKTCYCTAQTCREIFIECDIYACCIGCSGIFSNRPKIKSNPGAIEHE